MDNVTSRWNTLDEFWQVVIVIVLIVTSPLWIFPAIFIMTVLLAWALIDSLFSGCG